MKYYKYPHENSINKAVYKNRLCLMSEKNRRNNRTRRVLLDFDVVLFFLLVAGLILLCCILGTFGSISNGLKTFLQYFIGIVGIILSIVFCVFVYILVDKRFPFCPIPPANRAIVAQCVTPLKKYYKISDNYIVTKCYHSSDERLTNKDVLLFINDGKLGIVNDFTCTIKDFGCYEISRDELEYRYIDVNGLTATFIKCGDIEFTLGKRANPFIKKNIK